jgi:hypothetical protein
MRLAEVVRRRRYRLESSGRRGYLLLAGARWAKGRGRTALVDGSGPPSVGRGFFSIPWPLGSPEEGGGWREVSTRSVPMSGGMGEAPWGGQGARFVRLLGSRFAAAMLMQSYGPMHAHLRE